MPYYPSLAEGRSLENFEVDNIHAGVQILDTALEII